MARSMFCANSTRAIAGLGALTLIGTVAMLSGCGKSAANDVAQKPSSAVIPVPAPTSAAPIAASIPTVASTSNLPPECTAGSAKATGAIAGKMPGGVCPMSRPAASPKPDMDLGKGTSVAATPAIDSKIAQLEKSNGSKAELSALYSERATERMMDDQAAPRVKYRAVLQDDNHALKLDPTNKQAASNKSLIESIYRSLGRPIPE